MPKIESAHVSGNVIVQPAISVDIALPSGLEIPGGVPSAGLPIYNDVVLADSPIFFARLTDVGPTTIIEEINGFNGTAINTPTFGAEGLIVGGPDDSMSFSAASSEHCRMQDQNIYSFTDGVNDKPFSFESLIHITSLAATRAILSKSGFITVSENEYIHYVTASGQLGVALYTGTSVNNHGFLSNAGTITINTTYHTVATYTGVKNSGIMYINGVPVTTTPFESGTYTRMTNWDQQLRLGVYFPGDAAQKSMNGRMSKNALYDKVLTPAQVAAHFAATGL